MSDIPLVEIPAELLAQMRESLVSHCIAFRRRAQHARLQGHGDMHHGGQEGVLANGGARRELRGDRFALSLEAIVRASLIICVMALATIGLPVGARAQETTATPPAVVHDHVSSVWALAGINAEIDNRWQAIVRFGYLGGFESRILLARAPVAVGSR